MLKNSLLVLSLFLSPASADDLDCADAAAFYHYAMFNSKVIRSVAGSCAGNLSQSACVAFMDSLVEHGDDLDKTKQGDVSAYLSYLKDRCPDSMPENPDQF